MEREGVDDYEQMTEVMDFTVFIYIHSLYWAV